MAPHNLLHLPNETLTGIFAYVDHGDLRNLITVCKSVSGLASRQMFQRDAVSAQPRSIRFAAISLSEVEGVRIFQRYCSFGGDINVRLYLPNNGFFTVLHMAAARGHITTAQFLLVNGADTEAQAKGVWNMFCRASATFQPNFNSTFPGRQGREVKQVLWLPLFAPILNQHQPLYELLVQRSAPGNLTEPSTIPANPLSKVTVFHMARTEAELNRFVQHHPNTIRHTCPGTDFTPIHLALINGRGNMVEPLARAGCPCDTYDSESKTPLYRAIDSFSLGSTLAIRRAANDVVRILLQLGANPNRRSGVLRETALLKAVTVVPFCWTDRHREVKKLVEMLISNGANVNTRDAAGTSVLSSLCRSAKSAGGSPSIEDFIDRMITVHGADLNIPQAWPLRPAQSLIALCSNSAKSDRLAKRLEELGGRLLPTEIAAYFQQWAALFNILTGAFAIPGGAEQLVWDVLGDCRHRLPKLANGIVSDPGFHQNHVDATRGQGFLHSIVDKLQSTGGRLPYMEGSAVADAKLFLESGTAIQLRDGNGHTVLQHLRGIGQDFKKLERLFEKEELLIQ
ncbi:hypothetical protein QQZ08_009214 [Neonectria magnoliae]|uniref:F-box domain-containing protein n=1 Tax=Neonectria magnoliae TaxID=2732573 RepID=A0ABR1HQD9_9HYPO